MTELNIDTPASELVKKLLEIKDTLNKEANQQYSEEDCPLNLGDNTHHHLSNFLLGGGYMKWRCGFCGTKFVDY